jgi:hypothetical protein
MISFECLKCGNIVTESNMLPDGITAECTCGIHYVEEVIEEPTKPTDYESKG